MNRVLALVTDAYGGRGGIAQAARDLIAAFSAIETVGTIEVLVRSAVDEPTNLPDKVRQQPSSRGRIAYAIRSLLAACKGVDLVVCNHLYMAPLAALAARVAKARYVIQLHGVEIWSEPTLAQRKALEGADLLLCVSRDTRARALTYTDIAPERAVVLNNTVDACFNPGDRAAARVKFGLSKEFALLIVGRMDQRERYKGHDQLIAALPELKHPEGRPVTLLIAGDGDDRERLETEVIAAGIGDKVRFLARVPQQDLPDLYRAADLFVLPSTGEGFGIVYLEAMASGTPALGLAAGGAPDALGDGALGIKVKNAELLTAALQEAIASPPRYGRVLSNQTISCFGTLAFQERLAAVCDLMRKQAREAT